MGERVQATLDYYVMAWGKNCFDVRSTFGERWFIFLCRLQFLCCLEKTSLSFDQPEVALTGRHLRHVLRFKEINEKN